MTETKRDRLRRYKARRAAAVRSWKKLTSQQIVEVEPAANLTFTISALDAETLNRLRDAWMVQIAKVFPVVESKRFSV